MIKKPIAILLWVLAMCEAAAEQRAPELADLRQVVELTAPAASADGAWIAYTASHANVGANKTVSTVWLRSRDGASVREIAASAIDSAWQPAFTKDGSRIAFLSNQGGAHETQVWIEPVGGGQATQVTNLTGGVSDFVLAPDGEHVVVVAAVPSATEGDDSAPVVIDRFQFKDDARGYLTHRRMHLFRVNMADQTAIQLTKGDFDAALPACSPDGKYLAYVSKHGDDADRHTALNVYVIDAVSGAGERRISTDGLINNDPDHASRPAWSPDSRLLAYLQGGPEKWLEYAPWELAVVDIASGKVRRIGKGDRNYNHPAFSADGKSVFALIEESRNTWLGRIDLDTNHITRLTHGNRLDADLAVGPDDRVALLSSDDVHPYRMSIVSADNETMLPDHNDWLGQVTLAPAEDIEFRSKDGTVVHGMLVKPAGYVPGRRYPTLINLHGGPQYQFSHEYMFDWQVYAAHGYAVVAVNPRGSTGRGFAYSRAIWADWGSKDVQDVIAATDFAVKRGIADRNRLGVFGWSYGGQLTDYTIATTRRFKAAVAGAGSGNFLGNYGSDEYTAWLETELGTPWKNLDNYLRVSFPFYHSDRITTPTLFMCGQVDFNVPCGGSEQMYQALRSNDVAAQLVIYRNMHHEPDNPDTWLDRWTRTLQWFDRFLMSDQKQTTAP